MRRKPPRVARRKKRLPPLRKPDLTGEPEPRPLFRRPKNCSGRGQKSSKAGNSPPASGLVAAATGGSGRAGIATRLAATSAAGFAGDADQLDASDALGYRNAFDSSATTFVYNANAFAAGNFFLHAGQLQAGWLAAAAIVLGLAAGIGRSATTTVGQGHCRCAKEGHRENQR